MKPSWLAMLLVCLLAAACAAEPTPQPAAEPAPPEPTESLPTEAAVEEPEASEEVAEAVAEVAPFEGLPLPSERGELFAGSGACAVCHKNMVDEAGADVSNDAAWRSTMMANAARDPYWQATVRSEILANPPLREVIEDKCAQCHMPMARFTVAADGGTGQVLDGGFADPAHALHPLAMDGVSCTVCHQIEETNFGQAESFSGGYAIDPDLPSGERLNYGPLPVDEAQATIMQGASGFIPVQSEHVQQAELCATCHTLYTPYVDAAGEVAGVFPEQTPYLEWLNSDYADSLACQGCHMPEAEGGVVLSVTGGEPRSPVRQHRFGSSNVYMMQVLKAFGDAWAVTASSEQFDAAIAHAQDVLQTQTATVAIRDASATGSGLRAEVVVESQVGHKFPTGFPSRRAWLHVTVRDAAGDVVFESGAFGPDGAIEGNDNDTDPAAYEPHYLTVNGPDQVQIYEAIMGDTEEAVTTTLLRGAGYLKDNRLLPAGFDVATAGEDIAPFGRALDDEDFVGGGDTIAYEVGLEDAEGPFTVSVELLYQSTGYRWAKNLGQREAAEIATFLDAYQTVPNLPVVVASDTVDVAP